MLRRRILILFFCPFLFATCNKPDNTDNDCIYPAVVPLQPYSYPVWHPNGQLLGFNYTPLSGIGANGTAPCIWYSYAGKPDSTGFYIMNKNGTGFKRVTTYPLFAPAWSPDGNWLAFSLGSNIYKLRFTGSDFDTANIVQLTNGGGNFHPSWTANSDTIYFDSNVDSPPATSFYSIWRMLPTGNSKERVSPSGTYGRQPFVATNNLIYYFYYSGSQPEIFRMNKDGLNQTQLTFNSQSGNRDLPKFWQGNLFYNDNGSLRVIRSNNQDSKLAFPNVTYDVSTLGEIVYCKMDYEITKYNKQNGTLWIMNADGTNNRQLTFNNNF